MEIYNISGSWPNKSSLHKQSNHDHMIASSSSLPGAHAIYKALGMNVVFKGVGSCRWCQREEQQSRTGWDAVMRRIYIASSGICHLAGQH